MTEKTASEAAELSPALAEPTVHVRRGWITGLGLASLGMWMASLTPLQVSLPQQLQDITPHHKYVALAVVSAVGAISSVIATPLAGALSDRTTSTGGLRPAARPPAPLDAGHGRAGGRSAWPSSPSRTRCRAWPCSGCCSARSRTASTPACRPRSPITSRCASGPPWRAGSACPRPWAWSSGPSWSSQVFTINTKSGLADGYVTLAVLLLLLAIPFVLFTADYPLEAAPGGRPAQPAQAARPPTGSARGGTRTSAGPG